jgi:dipeptidyl aminopeptidase/acylaminoacyl peptidase
MRNGSWWLKACIAAALWMASPALAQTAVAGSDGYQTPPAPIAQILDAPPTPTVAISPTRTTMLLLDRANLPPIAELAEPTLKLAGYRINPRNSGPSNSRVSWLTGLTLQDVAGGKPRVVALPAGMRFLSPAWSPDGKALAFMADAPEGLELWVVDVATGQARKLVGPRLNATTGGGFSWLPDSSGLLVRLVPAGRGAAPVADQTPKGPLVQESMARVAPVRTYQDLLASPQDEALFEHYFTSQLAVVSLAGEEPKLVGAPGLILGASLSPDGRFILQTRIKRPFSYVVPAALFPADVVVTDLDGKVVRTVAALPLRDDIPPPFDAVAKGPRSAQWRDDTPSTLVWVEAQDEGDPRKEAAVRDRVFMLDAPFTAAPTVLIDLKERYAGVEFGRADVAIVHSQWWKTRHETRFLVNPSDPAAAPKVLVDRNYQGQYDDPGDFLSRANAAGRQVLQFTADGRGVYMSGPGASREGEFPFLDRLDLATGQKTRIWQARAPYYEFVIGLLDDGGDRFLTRRESRSEVPNIFLRKRSGASRQLTAFVDPAPQFAGVTKQLVTYKRADGVELSGTLYLPAGYDPKRDGRLPLLMWAYPTEFTDPKIAAEVVGTENRFTRPGGSSHLFMLTQGYAVLDNPTMPIIGPDGTANDTYVQQLVASAQAAADKVVEMGVADRDRLAVGGHSYGAFMTANLLAHSDIFRAGIARSGAYNRTLTPFGFQAEERTYWEAVDIYTQMSPFTHVKKIDEPILLIHGQADDNSGTFPVQSERFYAALKGNGANVRYVQLPLEAHGYRGRESVLHTLWEMTRWLDLNVKPAKPQPKTEK